MLVAYLLKIICPIFSICGQESFQVRKPIVVPQPWTLANLLAFSIGYYAQMNIKQAQDIAKQALVMARPLLSPMMYEELFLVENYFLLRRVRTEKLISKTVGRESNLRRLFDAMVRGFMFLQPSLYVVIIVSEDKIPQKINLESALRLPYRLGDTESLCCVEDVKKLKVKVMALKRNKKYEIATPIEFGLIWRDITSGSYLIVKMNDENNVTKEYVVPLEMKLKRVGKKTISIFKTSKVLFSPSHDMRGYFIEINGKPLLVGVFSSVSRKR